jgi:Ser/Thr protein kinase RdoA (MazF antagonist)
MSSSFGNRWFSTRNMPTWPCLDSWDIAPVSVELVSHRENLVFRVVTEGGDHYALRIHRPGYHTLAELQSEQLWTAALREFDVHVPRACQTRDGSYYAPVRIKGNTRYASLVEWLQGDALGHLLKTHPDEEFLARQMTQLGEITAIMHNCASRWQVPSDFIRHNLDIDGFFGDIPFWGRFWEVPALTSTQQQTLLNARERIGKRLATLSLDRQNYGIIHADLNQSNLLVCGDGLSVIDFDDAGFGWYLYDLAVALLNFQRHQDFEAIRNAMIAGYRKNRLISDDDLELLPMFMLIHGMAIIGWDADRPEQRKQQDRLRWINDVCRHASILGFA